MPLYGWESVSRDDPSYKACLQVTTGAFAVVGVMTGRSMGVGGTLAGAAAGLVWGFGVGYLACPYLAPAVKRKLESGQQLTEAEIRSAADSMSRYANVQQAAHAVRLVALVKSTAQTSFTGAVCRNPAHAARQLLAGA